MVISKNMDVGAKSYTMDKIKENDSYAVQDSSVNNKDEQNVSVTLTHNTQGRNIRTEQEIDNIIKDIIEKDIVGDLETTSADEMIKTANSNIYRMANEAILAQANSNAREVSELLV